MASNRNRDPDSGCTATTSGDNAVFVDTNLDTHLAVIVSHSDTVSDLKKKIRSEHPLCFPNHGEIKINALKVKRRRCFYHLSDSMLVKSAFGGAKKWWFVSADALSLKQHDDNRFRLDPAASKQPAVACHTSLCTSSPGIGNPEFVTVDTGKDVLNNVEMTSMGVGLEPCNTSFLDNNVRSDLGEMQGTHVECCNDKSRNMNGDADLNDSLVEEEQSKSIPVAKKKRKRKSEGDENLLEGNDTLLSNVNEDILKPKNKILENSLGYKLKTSATTSDSLLTEPLEDVHMVAGSGSGNKRSKKKKNPNIASVAAIVPETNMQYENSLGTFEVPQKQKCHEPVQEVVEKDKLPSSSVDTLFREPPEDDHFVAGTGKKKKSKKKRKLPSDQVIDAEPSSLLDVGIEGPKENVGTASKDSDKASGLVTISEQNVQHTTPSGTVKLSQKQKDSESVQEVVEGHKLPSSSRDSLVTEFPEGGHLAAVSIRGMKGSRKKKKLPSGEAVNAEPSSLLVAGIEGCKENGGIVSKDSHKESVSVLVSEQNDHCTTLSVQEVVEGHKLPSSSMDYLTMEPSEDFHPVAGSSSWTKKSKKKQKLPTDEAVNAEPSRVHDAGEEGSKENLGNVSKDSDEASGSVIVSELNDQHATLSGTVEISRKQKLTKIVQEVVEGHKLTSTPMGINASRLDAANVRDETDAPDSGGRSRSKGRKTSKKHHSVDMEGFPSLVVNTSGNLKKDDMQSWHANIALDNQNFETSPQNNEEQKELPQNHDPEAMLSGKFEPLIHSEADMHSKESIISDNMRESTIVMASGKSVGKRIKTRAKKSLATKVISHTEHDDNFNDRSTGDAEKEESFLSPTKKKTTSKQKMVGTCVLGAIGQTDDVCGSEAESLPSTRVDKTQQNAENCDGNLRKNAKKNENSDAKTSADFLVKEQKNEVGSLQLNQKVDMTRADAENVVKKSRKSTSKSQNSVAKSLSEFSTKEQEVGSEVNDMLRVVDTASKTRPLQHDDGGNASKNSKMTDANYEREASKCDGDSINFKDYFIPGERNLEVPPVELVIDNVIEAKRSDKETKTKTKKNAKKVVLPSPAATHDPGNSVNSSVNQGNDRRSQGVPKAPSKKMGEVVNSSKQEKSLLATPGAIFNGSSESSESESSTVNSDSSTKSPSDYSSSSGFSEGDGKLNLDSSRNGTSGAEDKDGGKSVTKSLALGSKSVPLDKILRSSSRFKKAKLTATQLQLEDPESQPVDFVPDSQVNL